MFRDFTVLFAVPVSYLLPVFLTVHLTKHYIPFRGVTKASPRLMTKNFAPNSTINDD